MTASESAIFTKWSWMFCRVVTWPKPREYRSATSAIASSCSGPRTPEGDLDPEHLHVRLTLAVDAAQQAEGAELLGVELAALEGFELLDELVDVSLVRKLGQKHLPRHDAPLTPWISKLAASNGRSRWSK